MVPWVSLMRQCRALCVWQMVAWYWPTIPALSKEPEWTFSVDWVVEASLKEGVVSEPHQLWPQPIRTQKKRELVSGSFQLQLGHFGDKWQVTWIRSGLFSTIFHFQVNIHPNSWLFAVHRGIYYPVVRGNHSKDPVMNRSVKWTVIREFEVA